MAWERLATGAVSLADANWLLANGTAGSGIADDATLAITDGQQSIVNDLDRSGETSTGIDYLHNTGFRGFLGTATAGSAIIEFDATYTTNPNFVWTGGTAYISAGSTTVTNSQQTAGTVYLTGGTWTNYGISGGNLIVQSGAVVTNLRISGGTVTILGAAATAPTLIEVTGGTLAQCDRAPTTLTVRGPGAVVNIASTTANITTGTVSVGRLNLQAGNIATLVIEDNGIVDVRKTIRPLTLGGTSVTVRGPNAQLLGRYAPNVTVSNYGETDGAWEGGDATPG